MKFLWKLAILAGISMVVSPAIAQELPLAGAQVRDGLSGNTVEGVQGGVNWKQYFNPSGATTYVSGGRASPGRWSVRDDTHCSQWPPSENWDCYALTGEGDRMTFVPEAGGASWPVRVIPGKRL